MLRFYDSSFSLLSLIDYSCLPDKIQEKVVDYFKNGDKENIYGNYEDAVIRFLKSSSIDNTELLNYIRESNSALEEKVKFELGHDASPEKYIGDFIDDIITYNKTQGKDGIFTFYGVNNFQTIFNIIKIDNVKLSEEIFNRLIDVCKQTIISDNQILSDKYSSFNLLFQIYFSQTHDYNWEKLTDVFQSLKRRAHGICNTTYKRN